MFAENKYYPLLRYHLFNLCFSLLNIKKRFFNSFTFYHFIPLLNFKSVKFFYEYIFYINVVVVVGFNTNY